MNAKKLKEYYKEVIEAIQGSKLSISDYEDVQIFIKNLEGYLNSQLKDPVIFVESEIKECIQVIYKGTGIIINLSNGITLTVTDNEKSEVLNEFKPIFTAIVGRGVTCGYNSESSNEKSGYATLEWSLYPEERIAELRKLSEENENLSFKDYYTPEVIKKLGHQLLSMEGYLRLFGDSDSLISEETYKLIQIQKMYPMLRTSILQSWVISCRNQLPLLKKVS